MPLKYTLRTKLTQADKFWEKVEVTDNCWIWLAARNHRGYGVFCVTIPRKRNILAHRWAYEFTYGPIAPETLFVLHQCDNPACVRFDHLRLGTHQENMEEMRKRGRSLIGNKNNSRQHPERLQRGDQHWMRRHPERIPPQFKREPKLTRADAEIVRARYQQGDISQQALADEYGVGRGTIADIVTNKTWKH